MTLHGTNRRELLSWGEFWAHVRRGGFSPSLVVRIRARSRRDRTINMGFYVFSSATDQGQICHRTQGWGERGRRLKIVLHARRESKFNLQVQKKGKVGSPDTGHSRPLLCPCTKVALLPSKNTHYNILLAFPHRFKWKFLFAI